jgi:hypothetical protein
MGIIFAGGYIQVIRESKLYEKIQQNKMLFILGGFMGINFIQGMISSTGAF